ncbi:MAG TPA: protein kinase [Thermoanaerobaculia bacterium]|nr:protein kinase [Thermoanaerobaculia bacterium]
MTAQSLDTMTPATMPAVTPSQLAVERPRFPLVWKIFFLTAPLIAIVVAVAVGLTFQRSQTIAHATADKSISSAARLFREFEKQRLSRLTLTTQLLGNDPNFVPYMQNAMHPAPDPANPTAPPAINYADIFDQLTQRKEALGTDVMMLLDDRGNLLGRTDRPALTAAPNENMAVESPLVKQIVDDATVPAVAGVLAEGNHLYHVAVAPLGLGANNVRLGYLVNGVAIDDAFANRIADLTNAGAVFASNAGPVGRSKSAPQFTMQQMTGVDNIFATGKMMPPKTVSIDRSQYVMTGEPMTSGSKTVGAAVFLRSLDVELAPFREIQKSLLLGGGGALLLAFILSWFIAKRLTRPIEELAGIAQAVTHGDYEVHPAIDRQDEVGILGRSFAKMITALRDKAELEELYEQMAAKSEEREAVRKSEPAKLEEGTVLVTDLRGLPPTVGGGDAANVIADVARVMRLQEAEVERQEGVVREIIGHRLVSVFRGDRGIIHAIRAARAINEELAAQSDITMQIGVGIATGEFVTGSVELQQESGLAVVGNAPLLAEVFAWHAPTGYAYISYETAQAAGNEILSSSTREEVTLRWLPHPLPVAAVPLVNLSSTMMRTLGQTTSSMATMRVDSTQAGITAPAGAVAELAAGALFANRYRIEQMIGRGGMGIVYRAIDTQLDETVAIKTLPGDVMQKSPEDLERFKREIRLARKITHRNVLRTYDYGEAEGVYFISMEYVRGYTLAELLEEAPDHRMAPRAAMGLSRQICRGLQAAHEQGIIHRDIKPQNVLIDHKGEVKLMDFGIARMAESTEGMTQVGLIVGTPHYMSPEQVQGQQLDARSDVYSMGVMLYEILSGVKPFTSSSLTGVLTAHITESPKPLVEQRPDIGRDVNAIVMRCLAKSPKDRYADAGTLLADLDRVQTQTVQQAAA